MGRGGTEATPLSPPAGGRGYGEGLNRRRQGVEREGRRRVDF